MLDLVRGEPAQWHAGLRCATAGQRRSEAPSLPRGLSVSPCDIKTHKSALCLMISVWRFNLRWFSFCVMVRSYVTLCRRVSTPRRRGGMEGGLRRRGWVYVTTSITTSAGPPPLSNPPHESPIISIYLSESEILHWVNCSLCMSRYLGIEIIIKYYGCVGYSITVLKEM